MHRIEHRCEKSGCKLRESSLPVAGMQAALFCNMLADGVEGACSETGATV